MIRRHEAEAQIFVLATEGSELPKEWRERILKLAALFAGEHVRDWNGLTLDSLRAALREAELYEYLRLIEPLVITEGPDDFACAIAPPPAPSMWQRIVERIRMMSRYAA